MLTRDARFRRLVADAFAAVDQGDLRRARELMRDVPDGRRSEAVRLLLEHRVAADPAAVSRIGDYGQGPALIRRIC